MRKKIGGGESFILHDTKTYAEVKRVLQDAEFRWLKGFQLIWKIRAALKFFMLEYMVPNHSLALLYVLYVGKR